jgi:hypothetical protein
MSLFNFPHTASIDDLFRLEAAQLEHFSLLLPLPADAIIRIDCRDLEIKGGPAIASLDQSYVHTVTWLVFGFNHVTLYSEGREVYRGSVPAHISRQALADLESGVSASEVDDMVATATLEKTLDVAETQTPTQQRAVPVIKSLRKISDKIGLSEEAIANQMIALNLSVFKDGENGFYKAPEADIEQWADRWSLQFARQQREWLLREEETAAEIPVETNGKVEAESTASADFNTGDTDDEPTLIEEPVAEEATTQAVPALKFNKKPRPSKEFTAKGYRDTLNKALKGLTDNPDEQLVICAAIASPEESELGNTALELISGLYSSADRQSKGARILKGLHTAAMQWMSDAKGTVATPEPAATT